MARRRRQSLTGKGRIPRARRIRPHRPSEIDKAPRDFPNDLFHQIERMEFTISELEDEPHRASVPPVVIIASNEERPLPGPFLRRCVFPATSSSANTTSRSRS